MIFKSVSSGPGGSSGELNVIQNYKNIRTIGLVKKPGYGKNKADLKIQSFFQLTFFNIMAQIIENLRPFSETRGNF